MLGGHYFKNGDVVIVPRCCGGVSQHWAILTVLILLNALITLIFCLGSICSFVGFVRACRKNKGKLYGATTRIHSFLS